MKNNVLIKIKGGFLVICSAFLILACRPEHDPEPVEKSDPITDPSGTPATPTVPKNGILADSYFWGTWVRMDSGTEYQFKERYVEYNGSYYENSSGSASYLNVKTLGTFERQSESVMLIGSIPLFRKGGADLEYSVKLVGFLGSSSRAAGTSGEGEESLANYTVTGTTEGFPSSENETISDSNGEAKLIAKRPGEQTVRVTTGDKEQTTHGLTVTRNGANVGKIVVANENDCSLKVTVPELENSTYLYANRSYENLEISIENTGTQNCGVAQVVLSANSDFVTLSGDTDFTTGTLKPGVSKTGKRFNLTFNTFSDPYIDVEISIQIKIFGTPDRIWDDGVSLRVFRGQMPVTISAASIENNPNARLKGFVIYPDKNHKHFSLKNNTSATLYVPTFSAENEFMMVFCGAATADSLADNTEMFYTVAFDTVEPRTVVTKGDNVGTYVHYGEDSGGNQTETSAYDTEGESSFEACLPDKDIDYYRIKVESSSTTYYGAESSYNLSVDSYSYNEAVLSWDLASGILDSNVCLYKDGRLVASGVSSPYTVKNLSENTNYNFILKNAYGDDISSAVTVKTAEKPSLTISCTSYSSTTADLKVVNNNTSSGTFYLYTNGYYGNITKTFSANSSVTFTVSGLSKKTTYTFVLKTSSSSDSDEISNEISVTTLAAEPVEGSPTLKVTDAMIQRGKQLGIAYNSYYGYYPYYEYSWSYTKLVWTSVAGAEKYKVYRYASNVTGLAISQIISKGSVVTTTSDTACTDSNINKAEDFLYYVVVPIDNSGVMQQANASNAVCVYLSDLDDYYGTFSWTTE
ncbi:MAG: hypothetical protein IJ158_04400 [Treponema sp.]|nr:hypothetical protein [Treponema sp.]